ncbi:hypothetical protein FOZ60_014549, partial [Perkinsus olseni]
MFNNGLPVGAPSSSSPSLTRHNWPSTNSLSSYCSGGGGGGGDNNSTNGGAPRRAPWSLLTEGPGSPPRPRNASTPCAGRSPSGLGAPLHTAASDPSFRYMASSPNMRRNMSSCSLGPISMVVDIANGKCEYEPTPQLVFVYGTLKRGCRNQKYMLPRGGSDDIVFVSAAQTAIPYPMIYDANYFFPYLLDIPGAGLLVEGEIYKVSPSKLRELDILEGCPRRYERRTMAIAPYDHKALERLMPDVYEEAVKVLAAANAEVASSQSSDCPPSPSSSPISKQKKAA